MDKRQALIDLFLNRDNEPELYRALVTKVSGQFCTVELLPDMLPVEDVSLVADADAQTWAYAVPKVNSMVLVGCVEHQVSSLCVIQCSDIDRWEVKIGETSVSASKDKVSVVQGKMEIELATGRVKIGNDSATLKALFDDLSSLIQNLKVVTAQGPSTALTPDSLASLTKFKAKYPQLLL